MATLAPGVVVELGEARDGFVTVRIPGVFSAHQGDHLWLSKAELESGAEPLPD